MPRYCPPRLPTLAMLLCLFGLLSWSQPIAADQAQLESRVRELLRPQLPDGAEIEVLPMSARFPACEDPQAFLPQPNQRLLGRVSLGIRCAGSDAQPRYLQVTISVPGDYLVARRAIAAGEIIEPGMLDVRQGRLERLPRGIVTAPEQVIGLQATRAFAAGSRLQRNALREPRLIERNARVTLEAQGPGFSITREAVALDGGGLDSEVRVRTDTGEVLRGRVIGSNRLQVEL